MLGVFSISKFTQPFMVRIKDTGMLLEGRFISITAVIHQKAEETSWRSPAQFHVAGDEPWRRWGTLSKLKRSGANENRIQRTL